MLAKLLRSTRFALVAALASAGVLAAGAASAVSSPVVSGGLAESFACPPTLLCESSADFSLDPPLPIKPVSGTIVFDPTQAGATSVDITLSDLDFTMTGLSGSVERIDFTNVTLSVLDMPVTSGPGIASDIEIDGSVVNGSISGSYEQLDGGGGVVVASKPFSDAFVSIDNFVCALDSDGVGTCGFDLGISARFSLDVDGANHFVVQTYNVVVPEPATGTLLALGMMGLAIVRRR